MICRMDFDMFFGILIFEPKWGFCMGYSLCMMADFQNALISGIFGVFWSSFLKRKTLNELYIGFCHVFWNFNFRAKVRILHRRFWRANRSSHLSIGAKDSSNRLVAGSLRNFPQDSWHSRAVSSGKANDFALGADVPPRRDLKLGIGEEGSRPA